MTTPWRVLATERTRDGTLSLEQRAARDFLIKVDGRILMNSLAHRSEVALGTLACDGLSRHTAPRVLVGGLGMGFTLRAVLDALPSDARVTVAELNPVIATWCRGPLADLTDHAVADPRVTVAIADVMAVVRDGVRAPAQGGTWDAVVWDLYVGPDASTRRDDPLYGTRAVDTVVAGLSPGGVFAVWGEDFHTGFARTMTAAGLTVRHVRPGHGGRRHVVYLGTRSNGPVASGKTAPSRG